MIYIDLIIGFLKVGIFSFGGAYGAIPVIRDIVLSYGWLTDDELTYMIAVSESTPGPIMVNLATYVGSSQAGFIGALLATIAVAFPAFVIMIGVVKVMEKVMNNRAVLAVLSGLVPCIIGLIFATGVYMTASRIIKLDSGVQVDAKAALIAVILVILMYGSKKIIGKQISPIMLIIISALLGMCIYS